MAKANMALGSIRHGRIILRLLIPGMSDVIARTMELSNHELIAYISLITVCRVDLMHVF